MGYIGKKLDTKLYDTYAKEEVDSTVVALQGIDSTKVDKVTSTDNAIVRFDGTTGQVQNSSVVIDDAGNVGIGTSSPGAGVHIKSLVNETGLKTEAEGAVVTHEMSNNSTEESNILRMLGGASNDHFWDIQANIDGSFSIDKNDSIKVVVTDDITRLKTNNVEIGQSGNASALWLYSPNGTKRAIYKDDGHIGFLNDVGSWALRTDNNGTTTITKKAGLNGTTLVVESNQAEEYGGQIKLQNNYYGSGTYMRVNSTSGLEIINNAYNMVNLAITDDAKLYLADSGEFMPLQGIMGNGRHKTWVGNLNDISWNSIYNIDPATAVNYPITSWGFVHTMVHNYGPSWRTQVWWNMMGNSAYMRYTGDSGSNWSAWTQFA